MAISTTPPRVNRLVLSKPDNNSKSIMSVGNRTRIYLFIYLSIFQEESLRGGLYYLGDLEIVDVSGVV